MMVHEALCLQNHAIALLSTDGFLKLKEQHCAEVQNTVCEMQDTDQKA